MLEVDQLLPEGRVFVGIPVGNRVLLEELQPAGQADFLAGVDERLAARQGEAQDGAGVRRGALALELGAGPGKKKKILH